jgi:hypothetical protein
VSGFVLESELVSAGPGVKGRKARGQKASSPRVSHPLDRCVQAGRPGLFYRTSAPARLVVRSLIPPPPIPRQSDLGGGRLGAGRGRIVDRGQAVSLLLNKSALKKAPEELGEEDQPRPT